MYLPSSWIHVLEGISVDFMSVAIPFQRFLSFIKLARWFLLLVIKFLIELASVLIWLTHFLNVKCFQVPSSWRPFLQGNVCTVQPLGTCPDLMSISYESRSDCQSLKQQTILPFPPPCLSVQIYMGSSKLGFSVRKKYSFLLSRSHRKQVFLLIDKGHLYHQSRISIKPVYC